MSLEDEPQTTEVDTKDSPVVEQPAEETPNPEANVEQTPADRGRAYIEEKQKELDKYWLPTMGPLYGMFAGVIFGAAGLTGMALPLGVTPGLVLGAGVASGIVGFINFAKALKVKNEINSLGLQ